MHHLFHLCCLSAHDNMCYPQAEEWVRSQKIIVVSIVSFFRILMQKVFKDIIYILETLIRARKQLELMTIIRQLIRSSKQISM